MLASSLAGCSRSLPTTGPLSTLDPIGPAAGSIASLWWAMLAGAVVVFLIVMAMFFIVMLRPAWVRNVSTKRWIVGGGLILPLLGLTPLLIYALVIGERLLPHLTAAPMRIEAEAHQWGWTFSYPAQGGATTDGVLHLPANTPIDMVVTSRDVIHAFWVPRLAGKIDAIPGHTNVLRIKADLPGRYSGLCNEFCGLGHAGMRFDVIVHPAAEFAAALVAQAEKAPAMAGPDTAEKVKP